jgi:hypothetical protein
MDSAKTERGSADGAVSAGNDGIVLYEALALGRYIVSGHRPEHAPIKKPDRRVLGCAELHCIAGYGFKDLLWIGMSPSDDPEKLVRGGLLLPSLSQLAL